MKKSYMRPLEVVGFKVAVAEAATAAGADLPVFEVFDSRRDLSVKADNFSLSISIVAANIRRPENGGAVGVHRPIALTIVDKMSNQLLVAKNVWITIPKGEVSLSLTIDIPLSTRNINFDTLYTVYLRDTLTDTHLIEKEVVFYDERDHHPIAKDWAVEGASIAPQFSERKFRSYKADERTPIRVRFDLARFNVHHSSDSPEMEIRVFFPCGSAIRCFCEAGFDSFDDCDMGKYRAEICFKASKATTGVCYAEILCLGKTINGFVFSTDDVATEGVWVADELQLMEYFAVTSYAKRYNGLKECIKGEGEYDAHKPLISGTDLERALDNFISSQLPEDRNDHREIEGEYSHGSGNHLRNSPVAYGDYWRV